MSMLHMGDAQVNTMAVSELNQDIAAYLKESAGKDMDEVIAEDSRIEVWNLLSELRKGLISWYAFKEDAEVLEVGAGFGALTGVLCEKCAHVTATERSAFRAQQLAERYENVENLDVYAADVRELSFDRKFDYILLVGVLEVIGGGTPDIRVYAEYVRYLKTLLADGGRLLLAVENRMGLKYFCGATDPYTNRAFAGINHYKQGTRGYTFSKKEIGDILSLAGFDHTKFYYPLPDYKMPQLIYTDDHLPDKNLKERLIPYYKRTDTLVAFEKELYNDIIDNGMFPAVANSFLIECTQNAPSGCVEYAAVSTDRGRERGFVTAILKEHGTEGGEQAESAKIVQKSFLYPEGRKSADRLMEHVRDLDKHGIPVVPHTQDEKGMITQPYITWPTLSNVLKDVIRSDHSLFERLLDRIQAYILQSSEQVRREDNVLLKRLLAAVDADASLTITEKRQEKERLQKLDFGPVLAKAYMELIPLNCFYSAQEDRFLYFDQEFVCENYPAQYVMFRAIRYIYCFTDHAERYYPREKVIDRYGLRDTWELYQQEEDRFLDRVRNHRRYEQFYKWAAVDGKRVLDNAGRLESEAEVIANYQVSDKMKKIWKVELSMLDEIDRICRKYDLRYFMVHGSLLGAVRHRGFIPWDDDLDLAMPREDYEKFVRVADQELTEPLSLHTAATEREFFWGGYARIRNKETTAITTQHLNHEGNKGIWVDILPYDSCTTDERLYHKKEKKIARYYGLLAAQSYGKELKRMLNKNVAAWKLTWLWSKLFSRSYLAKKLDQAMQLYPDPESPEIAFFTGYQKFRRLSARDFEACAYLTFERRKVPVPVGYENYLFTVMGKDYMKYPPKEEQKPKHAGIWDPDVPYTRYQDLLCHMFEGAEGKKLILWGAGLMFEDYMEQYGNKYRPFCLIDNDENKWGRFRMGIEICGPQKLLELPKDRYHLIICSFYYKEIAKQLEEMGIADYKVFVRHVNWIMEAENKS